MSRCAPPNPHRAAHTTTDKENRMAVKPPKTTTIAALEGRFEFVSYRWFDGKWCPAVFEKNGGYEIRILAARRYKGRDVVDTYDYFELDVDGVIRKSPRGYAQTYNNKVRVLDIADAVTKYAQEDPTVPAMRI